MRRKVQPAILQAAIKLFGQHSFHGVTTRALAKEARVSEPLIYMWFKSKENLYLQAINAVVAQVNQEFTQFILKMFEEPAPAGIAEAMRNWCAAIPAPSARLLVQVMVSDDKRIANAREPLEQVINALAKTLERQKKLNRKLNPQAAARLLVRALFWAKVIEGGATQDIEETLQQWLLCLQAPAGSK